MMQDTVVQPAISTQEHEAEGAHLLLTLHGCRRELLNDAGLLGELTRDAATASGATVLQIGIQQFHPQGVTAFAVLAESHASLHTYPEFGSVFWDCFTCGTTCDPEKTIAVLVEALKPTSMNKQMVLRK